MTAAAPPRIKIYSTDWCGFCQAEKRFLAEHQLAFDDINIEAEPGQAEEMYRLSGQTGVPFTIITQTGGRTVKILGYDRPRLIQVLGLKSP
jgi:glutaredoxin